MKTQSWKPFLRPKGFNEKRPYRLFRQWGPFLEFNALFVFDHQGVGILEGRVDGR